MDRFQKLVADAKKNIREVSVEESAAMAQSGAAMLVDVREKEEWKQERVPGAVHLSRGMIEAEIEERIPDTSASIICLCGGGSRSALVAESLQKMGYANVRSMAGGFRAWKAGGLPTEKAGAA
jgi:rhodanese-related sulfurtransferase